ncbi:MAG: hypothetical protein ACRDOI_00810 [Trebonia sp.]
MTGAATTAGVDTFIAGLRACGVDATVNGDVVVFTVVAAARSGPLTTPTGVAVSELPAWPAIPPHWVHLPAAVQFAATNASATETRPGWVRHSREIKGWGDAEEPAQAWLAHLRRVLRDAA